MKQLLIIIMFVVGGIFSVSAQQGEPRKGAPRESHEEVQILKIAYMSDKIGLTPEESAKFWPLYNQYWSEYMALNRKFRDIHKRINDQKIQDGDLDLLLSIYDSENGMRRRWSEEFKSVLSEDKVLRVFVSQESFKNYLLRRRVEDRDRR